MIERLEGKIDSLANSLSEIKTDVRDLKADLKPVFEHVHMVKGVAKAIGLIALMGGFVVAFIQLVLLGR